MGKHSVDLSDVFRVGFADYCRQGNKLPLEHYKVANAIMSCHTAALGGHIFQCEQCGHKKISYNSCRNRHCPSCQAAARAQWVDNRVKELIPVPYFHVVFTIPVELNPFVLRNKKVLYSILYKAASQTLHALAANPKYLGASIGFIAILHTWGQALFDHPHLHCVVPSGGLSDDCTQWKTTPRESFLFPVKVLSRLFRGKFLDMFKTAVNDNEILFHGTLEKFEENASMFRQLLNTLYNTEWVVYAKPPFAGPKAVLKYLGRYTHRIAISNSRITELTEETVYFRWKDYADNNKEKTMPLSHGEFIRRFLLHVLPKGFVRIRYFGFLGQSVKKDKLQLCRTLLGEESPESETVEIDNSKNGEIRIDKVSVKEQHHQCPLCKKGHLIPYREIPHSYQRNIEMAAVA